MSSSQDLNCPLRQNLAQPSAQRACSSFLPPLLPLPGAISPPPAILSRPRHEHVFSRVADLPEDASCPHVTMPVFCRFALVPDQKPLPPHSFRPLLPLAAARKDKALQVPGV